MPRRKTNFKPAAIIFDVDGVLTPGNSFYTADGKLLKEFGADDHDALLLLAPWVPIHFVTGDRNGFEISWRRIQVDMKFPLSLVSTERRSDWMAERWPLDRVVYMGDGIFDRWVFQRVAYGICPADGFHATRAEADFVTHHRGGRRAVAEACLHLLDLFFEAPQPKSLPKKTTSASSSSRKTLNANRS